MRTMRHVLALVAWFLIWVPTSLFVLVVMFKSVWSTGRGRTFSVAALTIIPTLALVARSMLFRGRKLA